MFRLVPWLCATDTSADALWDAQSETGSCSIGAGPGVNTRHNPYMVPTKSGYVPLFAVQQKLWLVIPSEQNLIYILTLEFSLQHSDILVVQSHASIKYLVINPLLKLESVCVYA